MDQNSINSTMSRLSDLNETMRENALVMNGRKDAGIIFNHLMYRVKAFQSGLKENEELGIRVANFGVAAEIHVRQIAFKDPNVIEFFGVDPDGNEVALIQHISQLSFMLSALKPIEEKPFRMGFR